MKSFLKHVHGVIVFGFLTINTICWFTPLFLLALVKLAIPVASFRRAITRVLMAIGENWIAVNRAILGRSGSLDWHAEGVEGLRHRGWYLVISNHQTWVDILILQIVLNRRIPFLKFFIKQELVWFPFLGVAWWALDMPFMKRYSPSYLAKHPEKKGKDLDATRKACEKFRDAPTSVINFVEGTRFSQEKRDARESPYRNLLKPRAGGIAIALSSMGELFDAVLDVTIYYPNGVPAFWAMCCGEHVDVVVEVEQRPVHKQLASGNYAGDRQYRRDVHQWLASIWSEKDQRLDSLSEADTRDSPG